MNTGPEDELFSSIYHEICYKFHRLPCHTWTHLVLDPRPVHLSQFNLENMRSILGTHHPTLMSMPGFRSCFCANFAWNTWNRVQFWGGTVKSACGGTRRAPKSTERWDHAFFFEILGCDLRNCCKNWVAAFFLDFLVTIFANYWRHSSSLAFSRKLLVQLYFNLY